MKALVYGGEGRREWTHVPDPRIDEPTDAIVGIDAVTICGTDLHILRGDVPEVTPGRVLGHEAVGTVEAVGSAVTTVVPGDRVLVSCITACGRCRYCRTGAYGQCRGGGGWILGHTVDGVQAEYARVPFADTSVHRLPQDVDDDAALMLADIVPTSYEVGVVNGHVRPGDTVAIVGAGPIGLAAVLTSRLYTPGRVVVIDRVPARLQAAKDLGAEVVIDSRDQNPVEVVHAFDDGLGADAVLEAVGIPETFELCTELVRPGGHVANIGVHGTKADLHLERLWAANVTLTTGLVDTWSTPTLLGLLRSHHLDVSRIVTHRFALEEMEEAYEVFAGAADTWALKVALHGSRGPSRADLMQA